MKYNLETIEKFVRREMSEEELIHFQSVMEGDIALKNEVHKMELIHEAMELEIENDLRSHLKTLRDPFGHSSKRVTLAKNRWWIAAALLIMASISLWLWYLSQSKESIDQFAQVHYIGYSDVRTRTEGEISRDRGQMIIAERSIEEAIPWYESRILEEPDNFEARFILADLYKQMGQIDNAKDQYHILATGESLLWKERAAWNYLMLSINHTWDQQAEKILETILNDPAHAFHQQALQLAVKMK